MEPVKENKNIENINGTLDLDELEKVTGGSNAHIAGVAGVAGAANVAGEAGAAWIASNAALNSNAAVANNASKGRLAGLKNDGSLARF